MSLKIDYIAGDPLPAEDVNDIVVAVLQNSHNIIELYLENFFASKITPFNGLFFDGFSDTTKGDIIDTALTAQASSGQAILTVADTTGFKVGHNINIFDIENLDEKVIQSVDSGVQITLTTNLDNTYALGSDVKRSTVNFDVANKKIDFENIGQSIDIEKDSSQFLDITDAAQTGLTITTDMTFEANIKIEAQISGATQYTFASKLDSTGDKRAYAFVYFEDGGIKKIGLITSNDGVSSARIGVAQTLTSGVWFHVAVAYDVSAGQMELFINGVSVGTASGGKTTIFAGTADFAIGALDVSGGGADLFDGLIDEARIWDDLRTGTEINTNKAKVLTWAEANLQGYWRFEGDLLDETSNNNDLTNNNSAVFSTDTNFTLSKSVYFSKLQSFQVAMANVRLWVVRNFTAQFNLAAGISAGATTLTITGDQTGKFANGNTIDISTDDNLTRERKTLTAVPSFGGGVTTLTFSATDNAFTTSDFVERVDVLPEISIVDKDASESFGTLTFVRSVVDFANSEVEDEYSFEPGTANEDVVVKLELSKEDQALAPFAKRLGVVFIE